MIRYCISISLFVYVLAIVNICVAGIKNDKPDIIGQKPLSTNQGQSLTVVFSDLTVIDLDNFYPWGFSLEISSGNNYTVTDQTITPSSGFNGTLIVPVRVNDGENNSKWYDLQVEVLPVLLNDQPLITGQASLTINENESITIQLSHLIVSDSDTDYPEDFTLTVQPSISSNYSVSGNTVTPTNNFSGTLTVPVKVNDGIDDSEPFNLQIQVTALNDKPIITGHAPLS
jgi:hypothetical protein